MTVLWLPIWYLSLKKELKITSDIGFLIMRTHWIQPFLNHFSVKHYQSLKTPNSDISKINPHSFLLELICPIDKSATWPYICKVIPNYFLGKSVAYVQIPMMTFSFPFGQYEEKKPFITGNVATCSWLQDFFFIIMSFS